MSSSIPTPTKRRVVVTGMGAITPIGSTLDDIWANVSAGNSGIKKLSMLPIEEQAVTIGGDIPDFAPEDYMDKRDSRRMDRYMQFGIAATKLAMDASGLKGNVDGHRFGVILGTGAGGIGTIETCMMRVKEHGLRKTSPFFVHMMLSDSASGRISIEYGAKGPNYCVVTACATGTDAVGQAFHSIASGQTDAMIAGGAEAPLTCLAISGFAAMRALSLREDDPTRASRPFDKNRDGFVMGEGGGTLVLEELEHAKARGAKIYGEVIGYGASSDANDIVAPHPEGDGASRAMENALQDAGIAATDINYINAHATSTPVGDTAEVKAIKRVFGDYASNGLAVSGTKSMHGHLLGGAGALESIICLQSLEHGVLPPTINHDETDPDCAGLDIVPNTARKVDNYTVAMSNSFGFGGHNASLIFKKYSNN